MSRLASFGKAVLRWLSGLVGAVAMLMVALVVWLSQGPISVGFLTPYLQDSLADTGLKVDVGDTVLAWRGFEEGLQVRLVRARVQANGGAQVELPELRVMLSGRGLLRGELRPASIELEGPRLHLVRERDGHFNLGLGGDASSEASLGDWLKSSFTDGAGAGAMSELNRIVLRNATLEIDDHALGRTFRAPGTELAIRRDGDAVALSLTGAVELGPRLVSLGLDARWHNAQSQGDADLRIDGLDPAALADLDPALAPLAALKLPLAARVQLAFDSAGLVAPVGLELRGKSGVIDAPEHFAKPVPVRQVEVRGSLALGFRDGLPAPETLRIEHLMLALGEDTGPQAEATGALTWSPAGPAIEANARITGLALKELDRYWPMDMAAKARAWVVANILDGVVPEARLAVKLPANFDKNDKTQREAVLFTFQFENVTALYIKQMPRITSGKGQARIDVQEFQLDLASGRAGKLALSEGKLVIDGLHVRDQTADIQLLVTGPVQAGLELLDSPPLGFASRFGFDPAGAGGSAAVRMRFNFPLESWLGLEHVRFAVAANLSDVALKKALGDYELAGGVLSMAVNPKGLAADGKAWLAGVPINFKWREEFGVPNAPSRYEASGVLDDAARARLGLALDAYLSGPVPLSLTANVRKGTIEARLDASLAGAMLKVDELEWRKPPGTPGRLLATVRSAPDGPVRIDELALDAGDLAARGRVELDRQSGVRLVELTRLAYSDADVSLRVERDARGNAAVALSGARIDLKRLNPPPGTKPKPATPRPVPGPVDLTKPRIAVKIGRLERLALSDTMGFAAVAGEFDLHGGRFARLRAQAVLEDGPPIRVEIAPAGPRRTLALHAADAAKLARALDLFAGATGGSLNLKGEIHDDEPGGPLVGRVLVDEFRVVKAPVLARILSLGSLTGIADLLNGNGITFTKLEIPFTALDDTYTIRDARAVGSALGITAAGTVDRAANRVDVRGTVVPAYTINSVLGSIPLLGTLLVGRQGEGVFAINYRVSGSTEDPSVSVNPLSALAPGFLRTIIGVLERGVESSTSIEPPPIEQR